MSKKSRSEDRVFDYYQNGLPDDFKFDKSKIVKKGKIDTSKSTVQISVKFEYEMLKQLRDKAEKKGLPYQTLMKQIIKNYLDEESIDIKEIKARLSLLEIKVATNPGLNKKPSKVTTKVKVKKRV
jgi:predicted DNA binding CopG/RHH family protein